MGANPTGIEREGQRDFYFFIHNVYANFFKDALDYFSLHLYPRFEYKVVGTYDKAVEYLQTECQYGRETDKPNKPALILNPSGEFDLADGNAGGKQLYRFPNLMPGFVKYIYDPIYQDKNVEVNVGFLRIQGDIELIMLLNSFYQYCDLKMLFMQIFAGYERWIYPQFFNTFIILPDEFINYQYTNQYTGLKYKIDWDSANAYTKLVKTIAKDKLVLPCTIKPIYKLTSFNDASERYGGTDQLAEWKLGATIHYEIEIPSWLILKTDYLVEKVDINISSGSAYSEYDFTVPNIRNFYTTNYEWGLDNTSHSIIDLDSTCSQNSELEYEFNTRFFHIATQSEVDSTGNLNIDLGFEVDDVDAIHINSKYGRMNYGDHYIFTNNFTTLTINRDNVDLEVNMIIEIFLYKRVHNGIL